MWSHDEHLYHPRRTWDMARSNSSTRRALSQLILVVLDSAFLGASFPPQQTAKKTPKTASCGYQNDPAVSLTLGVGVLLFLPGTVVNQARRERVTITLCSIRPSLPPSASKARSDDLPPHALCLGAMKITALLVMRAVGEEEPVQLATASDLSNFSYFQRPSVREVIVFVGRTIAKRTPTGRRQSVEHEEYMVHCYNRNGLCGLVFANAEYPPRSAFSVINKVLDEYTAAKGESWRSVDGDQKDALPMLDTALIKYQDPHEADKLLKIQKELDETKIILHKTIDSVLARGEKLDSLVDKSNDLSIASQMFYKQAKKTNQCCVLL